MCSSHSWAYSIRGLIAAVSASVTAFRAAVTEAPNSIASSDDRKVARAFAASDRIWKRGWKACETRTVTLSLIVDMAPVNVFACASIIPPMFPFSIASVIALIASSASIFPASAIALACWTVRPIDSASIFHAGMPIEASCIMS